MAKDLVDLLDSDDYFEKPGIMKKTFLDIHCKSGSILEEIIERLLNSSQFHFEFNRALKNGEVDYSIYSLTDVGKRRYLIDNNIYAVCPDCLT